MYDADGNGFITRDELVEVVTNSTRWMGMCCMSKTIAIEVSEKLTPGPNLIYSVH